jgi:hypothetical protein
MRSRVLASEGLYVPFRHTALSAVPILSWEVLEYRRFVRKHYHAPLTPYDRLLASPTCDDSLKDKLRAEFATLDPIHLLRNIREAQHELASMSDPAHSLHALTRVWTLLRS